MITVLHLLVEEYDLNNKLYLPFASLLSECDKGLGVVEVLEGRKSGISHSDLFALVDGQKSALRKDPSRKHLRRLHRF